MIIGLSGKKQHGKNLTADIIQELTIVPGSFFPPGSLSRDKEHQRFQQKSFAGKLKQIVSLLTGIALVDLEKEEVKNQYLPEEWNWIYDKDVHRGPVSEGMESRAKRYTVRELLQKIGTEAMRNNIHTDIWVNGLMSEYQEGFNWFYDGNEGFPDWVITDVRFPNEAEAIKRKDGLLIRINRDISHFAKIEGDHYSLPLPDNHPSETALDNYEGFSEIIVNDGTREELKEKVKLILQKHKIIK